MARPWTQSKSEVTHCLASSDLSKWVFNNKVQSTRVQMVFEGYKCSLGQSDTAMILFGKGQAIS